MRRRRHVLPFVALAMAGITGCGSNGPSYFIAGNSGAVLLVQWQAPVNGQASGSITYDQPSGSAPNETLSVTTVPVTVAISGSQVTLTVSGLDALFGGTTLSGTLSNGNLTIASLPNSTTGAINSTTLASSDSAAYNTAVAKLRRSIGQANAQAAAQQQQQQQQQQNAQAEQNAQNDASTLSQDAGNLSSDLTNLQSDVQTTNGDVATTRSDALQGAGAYCDNLTGVVDADVTGSVDADISGSFDPDLQTLSSDISTVRGDIAAVSRDLANLNSSGLGAPAGTAATVTTARQAIQNAIAKANGYIDQANAADAQAYAIADGLATGPCKGQGPGSPPAPVQHLG